MITTIYDKLGWTCYLVTIVYRQRRSALWRTGHGASVGQWCVFMCVLV